MSQIRMLTCASLALATVCVIGCSPSDDRLADLSRQSLLRQAEQNRQIAEQSKKVAEATHELVQADSLARADLIRAQSSLEAALQAERSQLNHQRDKLEQHRQQLADAKIREPVVARAIWSAALLLAVLLPLVLCLYLIRTLSTADPAQDLSELLVCELISEQPKLLPTIRAGQPGPGYPAPPPSLPATESNT